MTDVVMPQMGESIVEGTLTKWLKKPGDHVDRDEPLFEISTDKVDTEIPSPAAGTLAEVLVEEGKTVGINTVVGRIDDGAGNGARPAAAAKSAATPPSPAPPPAAQPPAAPPPPAPVQAQAPARRRLQRRHRVRRPLVKPSPLNRRSQPDRGNRPGRCRRWCGKWRARITSTWAALREPAPVDGSPSRMSRPIWRSNKPRPRRLRFLLLPLRHPGPRQLRRPPTPRPLLRRRAKCASSP